MIRIVEPSSQPWSNLSRSIIYYTSPFPDGGKYYRYILNEGKMSRITLDLPQESLNAILVVLQFISQRSRRSTRTYGTISMMRPLYTEIKIAEVQMFHWLRWCIRPWSRYSPHFTKNRCLVLFTGAPSLRKNFEKMGLQDKECTQCYTILFSF